MVLSLDLDSVGPDALWFVYHRGQEIFQGQWTKPIQNPCLHF